MSWIHEVNRRLGLQSQGVPEQPNKPRIQSQAKAPTRSLPSRKGTWACTKCSMILLVAALALDLLLYGGQESFAPPAVAMILLLVGWKADALGNQKKASGCGWLMLWVFLLLVTMGFLIGAVAGS